MHSLPGPLRAPTPSVPSAWQALPLLSFPPSTIPFRSRTFYLQIPPVLPFPIITLLSLPTAFNTQVIQLSCSYVVLVPLSTGSWRGVLVAVHPGATPEPRPCVAQVPCPSSLEADGLLGERDTGREKTVSLVSAPRDVRREEGRGLPGGRRSWASRNEKQTRKGNSRGWEQQEQRARCVQLAVAATYVVTREVGRSETGKAKGDRIVEPRPLSHFLNSSDTHQPEIPKPLCTADVPAYQAPCG